MRKIVVGAGEVGFSVSEYLAGEGHDVVVVELDEEKLTRVREQLDVLTIKGNGASPYVLEQAGVRECDLLIAVSNIDEVNLISCMVGDRFGVKTKIARVRDPDFYLVGGPITAQQLGIDMMINPEMEAADGIMALLRETEAVDIVRFAGGHVLLISVRIEPGARADGKAIMDLKPRRKRDFTVVAIVRDGETIIPHGDDIIKAGDLVFFIGQSNLLPSIYYLAGKKRERVERIMILGGTRIGYNLARRLEQAGATTVIIERDRSRCAELAEVLEKALVFQGDGTDVELLKSEGIETVQGFVAVTEDEENNIIASLLAKQMGAKKIVTLVNRPDYCSLIPAIGLESAISTRLSTINAIMRFIRRGQVVKVATFMESQAQVIELIASPGSGIVKNPLKSINFPRQAIIGSIIHDGAVIVPSGESQVSPGDRVIVFTLPQAISQVESLFS